MNKNLNNRLQGSNIKISIEATHSYFLIIPEVSIRVWCVVPDKLLFNVSGHVSRGQIFFVYYKFCHLCVQTVYVIDVFLLTIVLYNRHQFS